MRVTTTQMFNAATYNINKNKDKYFQVQEALITQKRINRPSDDPAGASQVSDVKNSMSRIEQYARNIERARSFTDTTEISLSHVIDELNSVLDLAVDINGGISSTVDYEVAALQIDSYFSNMIQSANAKDGDRYVFSGFRTTTEAFDSAGNYMGGSGESIEIEITNDSFLKANLCGDDVFKGPVDVFQSVTDMRNAINTSDQDQIKALIPQVKAALDQIIAIRSGIGNKSVRLDAAVENNLSLEEAYTEILANVEDIDIAEATTEYAYQEQVYQATLMVSSQIIQQSILDFIT
jgi:flagellar hook-associated protein 3 FlgL